eukprot:gnl/TRDRNA2_/TRDRNA2_167564_c1_seq5.p1 gnl/TRDRNA2_/TRDRNA2_167564_c1~~gnl/TRDRNA2_/TRDRNA2_167564_c1_seq5.p1  ORF type:complete len:135 (-),score=8.98 gnl/TRDRNA2_/TRDRNA2_167564_c1_seq5:13-417(-)
MFKTDKGNHFSVDAVHPVYEASHRPPAQSVLVESHASRGSALEAARSGTELETDRTSPSMRCKACAFHKGGHSLACGGRRNDWQQAAETSAAATPGALHGRHLAGKTTLHVLHTGGGAIRHTITRGVLPKRALS